MQRDNGLQSLMHVSANDVSHVSVI